MKQKAIRLGSRPIYVFVDSYNLLCAMSRIRLLDFKLIRPKSSPSPGLEPMAIIVYSL